MKTLVLCAFLAACLSACCSCPVQPDHAYNNGIPTTPPYPNPEHQ